MKLATVVLTASMLGGVSLLARSQAVTPAYPDAPPLTDLFPSGQARPDQFGLTADGRRTYFVDTAGDAWLYERPQRTKTRVVAGPLWDLSLSPAGNALAYTKGGPRRGDQFVWVLELDPASGQGRGAERRLSPNQGDVPSISPNGRLVAFARDDATGAGQSVVVVPIGGGAERVVAAALPSSLANIRWTPDGSALYLAVNPPVACVPEWSCLPLTPQLRQPLGTIRKVAVSGGAVATLASARGLGLGLSPDGTTLLYLDAGGSRRWVVANADGTRRDAVTLPANENPIGWLRGSSLLVAASGSIRRMRTMTLADGASRIVGDADALSDPSWSPDGKVIAVVARGAPAAEMRILNGDGSPQRAIPLPDSFVNGTTWSPDQRWLAYLGFGENTPPRVTLVELATLRCQPLYDVATEASVSLRWLADSRGLVVTETFGRPENKRRAVVRTLDLSGKATLVREIPLGPPPSTGLAIDDTKALVMENARAAVRIGRLAGDAADRDVLPAAGGDSSGIALSADGQWVARRRTETPPGGTPVNLLDLARIDGSAQRTIPISFVPAPGNNPKVAAGGNDLVVLEGRRPDGDASAYLVSAGTGAVRKLFTYPSQTTQPELAISPDGQVLLYLVWETVPPALRTIDLSAQRGR